MRFVAFVCVVSLSVLASAAGCKKKNIANESTPSKSPVGAVAGAGFAGLPMGAADAIEPPSRDILPGITIEQAKAKGAKSDRVPNTLTWRPGIVLLSATPPSVITELKVDYPAKEWEALKAKWGKPAFENVWIGANWLASTNGCANGACTVSFARSPMSLLSKIVAPPGPTALLHAGMKKPEVDKIIGVSLSDQAYQGDVGFGCDIKIDYQRDGSLDSIEMSFNEGTNADWLAPLTALWGPPVMIDGMQSWVNAKNRWLATYDKNAPPRFVPFTPMASLLAKSGPDSALARAETALGKSKSVLKSLPGFIEDRDEFSMLATEFAVGSDPQMNVRYDDKQVVNDVEIRIRTDDDEKVAEVMKMLVTNWGPITTSKDGDGNEVTSIKVDGVTAIVQKVEGITIDVTTSVSRDE